MADPRLYMVSELMGLKITLETSSEDATYTRNEWRRCKTTLETSGEDVLNLFA